MKNQGQYDERGLEVGRWSYWYENGKKKEEGVRDGTGSHSETGEWRAWYEDGSPEAILHPRSNGQNTYWYENGKVSRKGGVSGGSPCGIQSCWDEDGNPEPCGEWEDIRLSLRDCEPTKTGAICKIKCAKK